MSFVYPRTVRFADTDAAGVVYFANILSMCHEAYEASLADSGIDLQSFFSNPAAAIPIVYASVDFRQPMFCGDRLAIRLTPQLLGEDEFEVCYQILRLEPCVASAVTRHVCIDPARRTRKPLPTNALQWLHSENRDPTGY